MPSKASEREKRRAKALRENLRRRKQASMPAGQRAASAPVPGHKKSPDGLNKAQKPD
ncbi:MAG TPA: hypothetical protein VGJ08_16725 [Rhizomicrobium sp.]|jgi:hypothetical protein